MSFFVCPPLNRPFLKWPGGKFRYLQLLKTHLPAGDRLAEPFVGAGSVFLNTQYPSYWINDINSDLMAVYRCLQKSAVHFIKDSQTFFKEENNCSEAYYRLRNTFNAISDPHLKAPFFLYLNRHGYNGLCRYNKNGYYNVPFGAYKKPYFPHTELLVCEKKMAQVQCCQLDFRVFLEGLPSHSVVYCDPPYWPLSKTANFTHYSAALFGIKEQEDLVKYAKYLQKKGISVVISNHDIPDTRVLYSGAEIITFKTYRSIAPGKKSRKLVKELLAIFKGARLWPKPYER